MKRLRVLRWLLAGALVLGLAIVVYLNRDLWHADEPAAPPTQPVSATVKVIVSDLAQKNLGLTTEPLKPQSYWRTLSLPAQIVEKPGRSQRDIVAPAAGVVADIAHVPGDTVQPGATLFTLKLLSEPLHQTQTELFKATQEIKIVLAQRKRFDAGGGLVAESRMIELDNQLTRHEVAVRALRQELLQRGWSPAQLDGVAEGRFVTELTVGVPNAARAFELRHLAVKAGQHVQAGETLGLLADHRELLLEGRAFRDEAPLLERSLAQQWPVAVDFQDDAAGWPQLSTVPRITALRNIVDPVLRTFAFHLPLENQARTVEVDGRSHFLWRFRPGQQVRLQVRVEQFDNVFVLPVAALTREGPESFVFTQNANTFERRPVRVLLQDARHVVLANDGALLVGEFVAQSAAAQLDRMVKAGSGGVPKGFHVHADGSLHKNHDEGK